MLGSDVWGCSCGTDGGACFASQSVMKTRFCPMARGAATLVNVSMRAHTAPRCAGGTCRVGRDQMRGYTRALQFTRRARPGEGQGPSSGMLACPSCAVRSSANSSSPIDWIPLAAHGEEAPAAVGLNGGGGLAGRGLFITGGFRACWTDSSAAGSLLPLFRVLGAAGRGTGSSAAGSLRPLFRALGAAGPSLCLLFVVMPFGGMRERQVEPANGSEWERPGQSWKGLILDESPWLFTGLFADGFGHHAGSGGAAPP